MTSIPEPFIQALRLKTSLGIEIAASSPERLAGITILPQRSPLDQQAQVEGWKPSVDDRKIVVFWREYSRQHIENGWEIEPGYGLWELKRAEIVGAQALEDLLQEWGISLASLTYLWKTAIPE
jgi:hypothetical protein